jgi:hypothetical protein
MSFLISKRLYLSAKIPQGILDFSCEEEIQLAYLKLDANMEEQLWSFFTK